MSDSFDPRQLDRYLLGLLPDDEAKAIEERYFEDEAFFARIEVAADDLAARFSAGELTAEESTRFRSHMLGTEDDRLRLRIAAASARVSAARPALSSHGPVSHGAISRLPSWALRAASVVVVLGAGILFWRIAVLQNELGRLRSALEIDQASIRSAVNQARVADDRRQEAERALTRLTSVQFVLAPGSERSTTTPFAIPSGTDVVRLELATEQPVSGRHRIVIRNTDRNVVWSQDVDTPSGSASVGVIVPTAVFREPSYELILQRLTAGSIVDVANYVLNVRRLSR